MMRTLGLIVLVVCLGLFGWKIKERLNFGDFSLGSTANGKTSSSPDYVTNYKEAKKQSDATGKPLLLIFSASWCGPCQTNKKRLYPHEQIQPFHDEFVWTYLDIDKPENARLAKQYRVNGIPSLHVISAEGKHLGSTGGSQRPRKFAAFLKRTL